MKNPVLIRDAEGEKSMLLSALIFFGMIARHAEDRVLSEKVIPIRKLNLTINVEERKNPPGHLTLHDIFLKCAGFR